MRHRSRSTREDRHGPTDRPHPRRRHGGRHRPPRRGRPRRAHRRRRGRPVRGGQVHRLPALGHPRRPRRRRARQLCPPRSSRSSTPMRLRDGACVELVECLRGRAAATSTGTASMPSILLLKSEAARPARRRSTSELLGRASRHGGGRTDVLQARGVVADEGALPGGDGARRRSRPSTTGRLLVIVPAPQVPDGRAHRRHGRRSTSALAARGSSRPVPGLRAARAPAAPSSQATRDVCTASSDRPGRCHHRAPPSRTAEAAPEESAGLLERPAHEHPGEVLAVLGGGVDVALGLGALGGPLGGLGGGGAHRRRRRPRRRRPAGSSPCSPAPRRCGPRPAPRRRRRWPSPGPGG